MLSLPRLQGVTLLVTTLVFVATPIFGQAPQAPYAAINRNAVNYAGPGRDSAHDLSGTEIKIGILAPLSGPRRAEGEALIQAAQLAVEDEAATPLPEGRQIALALRDENGPWGRAASEVVRLVDEDRAIALITSSDGNSAHLAEQVSTKLGVPVLTLSTDSSTTQINLPWIFRLGPSDLDQATVIARDIYLQRRLKSVALVTQYDHDGRVGGEEFEKAARELSPAAPPISLRVHVAGDGSVQDASVIAQQIVAQNPGALVFWTRPQTASQLVAQIRLPSVPIYLCEEAAQRGFVLDSEERCRSCPGESGGIWIVSATGDTSGARPSSIHADFEKRFRDSTGMSPTLAAAQAYDSVRLIAAALRQAGPNRARLRDALAETRDFPGASGTITFDHAGNDLATRTLLRLH